MRNHNLKILLVLFSFMLCGALTAQYRSFAFERLTIKEGLSNNSINSVLQTSDGYLWIATKDGLNRYDGHSFKVFKRNALDSTSLPENYVMSLLETRDGNFWIGTWGGGLCRYNPYYETFYRYDRTDIDDNYVQSVFEDSFGYIWYCTTKGGLNKLNPNTSEVIEFSKESNFYFPSDNITSIIEDEEHNLWVGTLGDGLIKFNPSLGILEQFLNSSLDLNSISNNSVWHILLDSKDVLYLSTESGWDKFEYKKYVFTHQPKTPTKLQPFLRTSIRQTVKDRQGRYWLGTYNYRGLFLFENKKNGSVRTTHLRREDDNEHSIISDRIRCIYQDSRDNIWIGTEDGLSKLPASQPFMQYQYFPLRKNSLGGRVVSGIYEGKNNILWVGLGGGGFDGIDLNTDEVWHYKNNPNNKNSLSENDVVTIHEDKNGILWIGTSNGGLNRFDPKTKKFTRYLHDPSKSGSISSNWVQQILETSDGLFLVGTNEALEIFDREKEIFKLYSPIIKSGAELFPSITQINALYEDKENNLWIGTWLNGLFRYEPKEHSLHQYMPDTQDPNSISTTKITTIYEDGLGFIWIGTHSGGLNRFDKKSEKFVTYTTQNGLPNDVVFGIQEDSKGSLWVSTMNGLARFNPRSETYRVYDETDGIIHNQFNWRASFKNSSGILYFGGINGLIYFHPDSIKIDTVAPPIVLSSFKIFNKEAELGQSIYSTQEIILPYDQNFFSIEFIALDIAPKHKHSFAYMLEGIDPNWVYSEVQSSASYTDIRSGSYTFWAKASNADRVWSKPISISVVILPAWWNTWWFRLIAGTIIIGIGFGIYNYRISQLLQIHHIRYNIASDLHDEIGSNLSSISVESQMLLESAPLNTTEREQLMDISTTSKETVDAMRDIIWFINPQNTSGEDITFKMNETAVRLLAGIQWTFNVSQYVRFDQFNLEVRRNIFLIYKEVLTNVARHSNAARCDITIEGNSDIVTITIIDNGKGFSINNTKMNSGLYNIKHRAQKIQASLELNSEIGRGTRVRLEIHVKTKVLPSRKEFLTATGIASPGIKKLYFRLKEIVSSKS
ncbi:MAG: two-component regulator propeller domain-containing protein [Bacteroidota bacterium]